MKAAVLFFCTGILLLVISWMFRQNTKKAKDKLEGSDSQVVPTLERLQKISIVLGIILLAVGVLLFVATRS